ncbi:MAG: HAMP domain-containing sensor histidine kinase [bacterium]
MDAKLPDQPNASDRREAPSPEKLAKLGLLVAGIAHNLYGPLTGILGTLDLLRLKHPDLIGDFERIASLARRIQDEIRVMLYKAEIEQKGRIAIVDLVKLVKLDIEFYKGDPRLKHMIEVTFDPPQNLPTFKGTIGDFSQSISNIIANAIEAMEDSDRKELTISLEEKGDNLVLSFADTGVGMDEGTKAQAFDPFFSTKTPTTGGKFPATLATGLGLAHARNLLEPEGVSIDLESAPGKGTRVTLTIPYKDIDRRHSSL